MGKIFAINPNLLISIFAPPNLFFLIWGNVSKMKEEIARAVQAY